MMATTMKFPTFMTLLAAALAFTAFLSPHPALARGFYTYIQNDAEYSVDLPDAPVGHTIWADQKQPIPFLENPPKFGSLGEVATLRMVDPDSGNAFDVSITFIKADRDFLLSMTQEKMTMALAELYKDMPLDQREQHFSAGSDTLKWATLTGYSADKNNSLHFNAAHYLVGLSSIMVIKVSYNIEDKTYQSYYDQLAKSIKYAGLK